MFTDCSLHWWSLGWLGQLPLLDWVAAGEAAGGPGLAWLLGLMLWEQRVCRGQ